MFQRRAMTRQRYMELYTYVYNYCTSVASQQAAASSAAAQQRAGNSKNKKTQQTSGGQFVGLELYKKLREYLKNYQLGLLSQVK